MNSQKKILSTKKLSKAQRELLNPYDVDVMELIEITYNTDFTVSHSIKNAVFTSKNAVVGLFRQFSTGQLQLENVFCVGEKTAQYLEDLKVKVKHTAPSAAALADALLLYPKIEEVYFFCGNLRRDELPEILTKYHIKVHEVEVYATHFKEETIKSTYDGILFFSPSSVKSYFIKNKATQSVAFCIGHTTASEAILHFEHVIVADEPNVEHVIKSVNQYFNYE